MIQQCDRYTLQLICNFCINEITDMMVLSKSMYMMLRCLPLENMLRDIIKKERPFYEKLLCLTSVYKKCSINILYRIFNFVHIGRRPNKFYTHILYDYEIIFSERNNTRELAIAHAIRKKYKKDTMWKLLHGDYICYLDTEDDFLYNYAYNAVYDELLWCNYHYDELEWPEDENYVLDQSLVHSKFANDILTLFPLNYFQKHSQQSYSSYLLELVYGFDDKEDDQLQDNLLAGTTFSSVRLNLIPFVDQIIANVKVYNKDVEKLIKVEIREYLNTTETLYISHIDLPSNLYIINNLFIIIDMISPSIFYERFSIEGLKDRLFNELDSYYYITSNDNTDSCNLDITVDASIKHKVIILEYNQE